MPYSGSPSSRRPLLVSLAHAASKVIGSLFLTVTILVVLVAIMFWGTVVEKNYGATAAKFGIYGAWWFNALGFILGLNSAVALIYRWPWRLQQLGFIIPHLGLIVLLLGCFLSRRYGVEATLSVFEGQSSDLAYRGSSQHVELDGQQHFGLRVISTDGLEKAAEPIHVPFTSGPFNWADYHNGTLGSIPWSLAHRDQGVLYDRDGIRLEVLDYLSNSEIVNLPSLDVHASPLGPDGRESSEQAQSFRFSVKADAGPHSAGKPFGVGREETLEGGQRILFWMTGSAEETAALLQSKPEGPLGRLGRVVLFFGGKPYDLPISDWKPGSRRALGDSGVDVELAGVDAGQVSMQGDAPLDVQVRLIVHRNSASHPLVLSADYPEVYSRQDYDDKVFGTYWAGQPDKPGENSQTKSDPQPAVSPDKDLGSNAGPTAKTEPSVKTDAKNGEGNVKAKKQEEKTEAKADAKAAIEPSPVVEAKPGPPRIEFIQGADQQLYLRTWRAGQVRISGPLKMGESGGRITAFRDTPDAVVLRFGDFQPADRPGFSAHALSFDNANESPHLRQAYVRLTVDGRSEEFWMPCSSPDPVEKKVFDIPQKLLKKSVVGKGRRVDLSFAPESFHLGYSIRLHKAWRKLDPGTRQASFYGSEIDLVPSESAAQSSSTGFSGRQPPEYENLLVTLNAPLDFADPAAPGQSYRMFQSTMNGPYNPEDFGLKLAESAYLSGFTLNYDPGRGLTYVGCLLIVAGIFVAYFVRFVVPSRNPTRDAETMVAAQYAETPIGNAIRGVP